MGSIMCNVPTCFCFLFLFSHRKVLKMLNDRPHKITLAAAAKIKKARGVGDLLTMPSANSKLAKSSGFFNCGITLAQGNISGHEVCHGRGNCFRFESNGETFTPCLGNQGRAEHLPAIANYRIARTRFLFDHPQEFAQCLFAELSAVDRKAQRLGVRVAFRANILSDLDWARIAPWLFESFPNWVFYDYTKIYKRALKFVQKETPKNYHLTYSLNEDNKAHAFEILRKGGNISAVFRKEIPKKYNGFKVIDADETDLRFTDPRNVICGLKAKGQARTDYSGFVLD